MNRRSCCAALLVFGALVSGCSSDGATTSTNEHVAVQAPAEESAVQEPVDETATREPADEAEPSAPTSISPELNSDLPVDIPNDFEAWSGQGVLAEIDPALRNGLYDRPPPMTLEDGADYWALIETSDGTMIFDLFEDVAPVTVNSFVSLARDGYFDGTRFHRVIEGFMAQGGDPSGDGSGGPGYSFDDEETGLSPIDRRGLLAMAGASPDTNGSQFFITFDAATHLNGNHVVFGELIDGDDVLSRIDTRDPSAPTSLGEEVLEVIVELANSRFDQDSFCSAGFERLFEGTSESGGEDYSTGERVGDVVVSICRGPGGALEYYGLDLGSGADIRLSACQQVPEVWVARDGDWTYTVVDERNGDRAVPGVITRTGPNDSITGWDLWRDVTRNSALQDSPGAQPC